MLLLIWNVPLHCVGLCFLLLSCLLISSTSFIYFAAYALNTLETITSELVLCSAGMPCAC